MHTHRVETILHEDGKVTLDDLPFPAGQSVEIFIVPTDSPKKPKKRKYPLRGTPITYDDPTAPVADADWEALR